MIKSIFPLGLLILILCGCASARFTSYRGPQTLNQDYEYPASVIYRAIVTYAYEKNYEVLSGSEELRVLRLRYSFPNAYTWSQSQTVITPYAESMGLFINSYGKNPFVTANIRVKEISENKSNISISAEFQTWGEPQGVGGAGPYPLNSKLVWEQHLLDEIAEYVKHE